MSKLNSIVSNTLGVGEEGDSSCRASSWCQWTSRSPLGLPAFEGQPIDLAVAPDLEVQGFRQCVHDRDANTVESARYFVAVVVELAAGVQHREHDFGRRSTALVHVHRNAAAVIDDRDRVVDVDGDGDGIAVARQRFVYRIVDDFVDEVVQTLAAPWIRCTSPAADERLRGPSSTLILSAP